MDPLGLEDNDEKKERKLKKSERQRLRNINKQQAKDVERYKKDIARAKGDKKKIDRIKRNFKKKMTRAFERTLQILHPEIYKQYMKTAGKGEDGFWDNVASVGGSFLKGWSQGGLAFPALIPGQENAVKDYYKAGFGVDVNKDWWNSSKTMHALAIHLLMVAGGKRIGDLSASEIIALESMGIGSAYAGGARGDNLILTSGIAVLGGGAANIDKNITITELTGVNAATNLGSQLFTHGTDLREYSPTSFAISALAPIATQVFETPAAQAWVTSFLQGGVDYAISENKKLNGDD